MTIYLLNSDARQIPLADQSVQCIITSPPYYGLRDYGTARWDGGDPMCDHSPAATVAGADALPEVPRRERMQAYECKKYGGDNKMKILNLGWGVQSFTIAAMVALGELEPIDAAIHADTTHERSATYTFAEKWSPWLKEHSVNVVVVYDKKAAIEVLSGKMIPAFTEHGQAFRSCTDRWKFRPIRRWLQANRNGEMIEQWLGISTDEAERMKPSDVRYITSRWPLIEKRMSRNDCINWLQRHDLEVPVKSSCVFCPYHNRRAWYDIKREDGTDWKKAVEVDEAIRKARPPFDLFLHSDRIPLTEIKSPQDNGQLDMFSEECTGFCFV